MFARQQPTPRSDEERAARRAYEARYKDNLDQVVGRELIQAVKLARPGLVAEGERALRGVSLVYLASLQPSRRHREHKGGFSLHSHELDGAFGRGRFKALARKHLIATVEREWGWGSTEAWVLDADFERRVAAELGAHNRAVASGPPESQASAVKSRPRRRWTARHHLQGLDRKLVGTATLTPVVPVNLNELIALKDILASLESQSVEERRRQFGRLKINPHADLADMRRVLEGVVYFARHDSAGYGYITHEYVMKPTGRLFGMWPGLQAVPRVIKRFALMGSFVYDFENCHFTIVHQLVTRSGHDCPALSNYLLCKNEVRERIARDVGISVPQAKSCLIALGYGASDTEWNGAAIPKAIGREAARRLYAHPLFRDLYDELEALRPLILQPYWTRKKVLRNALGLAFDEEARCAEGGRPEPKQQAHVLQGIEAQALLAVLRAYPDDIQLLEHDGFVSRREIPKDEIERLVKAETGFDLTLSCEVNKRPRT